MQHLIAFRVEPKFSKEFARGNIGAMTDGWLINHWANEGINASRRFFKEFGLTLRVYDGREFADPSQTLAQVRKKKGSGKDLSVAKNMKVGNLEDKFEEEFGLKVQVAGSDDSYLCKNELTLNAAQQEDEKKLARKERKAARQEEASDDGDSDPTDMPKDSQNMLHLGFYAERVSINLFFDDEFPFTREDLDRVDLQLMFDNSFMEWDGLTNPLSDAIKLLELNRRVKGLSTDSKDPRFLEMKNLLEKNIFPLYMPENAETIDDSWNNLFENLGEEEDADKFEVVKIYTHEPRDGILFHAGERSISFSVQGSFKLNINKGIKTTNILREIEDELGGNFDNGITINNYKFNINPESLDESSFEICQWEGHEGLEIWVIEDS